MIHLSGRVICPNAETAARLAGLLPDHIRLTRAEPGCLSFEVTQSDDPLIWQVEERFADRAAFDAHQSRTAASGFAAATVGIMRDYKITEAP
ncbi:quinol monooxygenase YgiN [Roseicyclus mahoneyensis]|uniref:Quinol monooxygenase YgiN n=2 Tax=Roseicyclus mahoneyensis TaxID=164332 RepID=A0A316GPZ2_9RHOB|nr:antibiotic biosynthesis monooxygenase [Roseicyclus mahoneyensis]PWK62789.1 quinol monooxygenase YgiN [Roseicyclus mahoneyensis]